MNFEAILYRESCFNWLNGCISGCYGNAQAANHNEMLCKMPSFKIGLERDSQCKNFRVRKIGAFNASSLIPDWLFILVHSEKKRKHKGKETNAFLFFPSEKWYLPHCFPKFSVWARSLFLWKKSSEKKEVKKVIFSPSMHETHSEPWTPFILLHVDVMLLSLREGV